MTLIYDLLYDNHNQKHRDHVNNKEENPNESLELSVKFSKTTSGYWSYFFGMASMEDIEPQLHEYDEDSKQYGIKEDDHNIVA